MPTQFPVESDRSLVNWFSVGSGSCEEQLVVLRNTLPEPISLAVIVRDSACFKILVPAGQVDTAELVIPPHATRDVRLVYSPAGGGPAHRGKLVLKPHGKAVGGKSFKVRRIFSLLESRDVHRKC